ASFGFDPLSGRLGRAAFRAVVGLRVEMAQRARRKRNRGELLFLGFQVPEAGPHHLAGIVVTSARHQPLDQRIEMLGQSNFHRFHFGIDAIYCQSVRPLNNSQPMNAPREELLFQLALTKPALERAAWLDRECASDSALRARLEALLAAH